MVRSPKTIAIGVSSFILLIAAVLIVGFYRNDQAIILDETYGDSTIYIESTRHAVLFPGECLPVRWEVNSIHAVYLQKGVHQLGTTGENNTVYCVWHEDPNLRVDFPDETTETYTLEILHLYESPLITLGLVIVIIAACTLAYFTVGMPLVLVILTVVCFSPILSINAFAEQDFLSHLYWVQTANFSGNFQDIPPHFVFHLAAIILHKIIPTLTLERAAFWVVLIAQVGTVLGLYALFRFLDSRSEDDKRLDLIYGAFALALMFAGPITYFLNSMSMPRTSPYLYPNTYHSPTMIVLRAFAVWLFVMLVTVPPKWSKRVILHLIGIVVLLILGSFSKPNYTLVIMPAYLCILGIRFLRDRQISRNAIVVGATLFISTIIIMGWQYAAVFNPESANVIAQEDSEIIVRWFGLYRMWGISYWVALCAWFVSTIFPLSVYILYIRKAWRDDSLNLAWIALFGAVAMALLFIEVPRTGHGNFVWGGQITNLILFGASASFLMRQWTDDISWRLDWRFWICVVLFAIHIINFSYILLNSYR